MTSSVLQQLMSTIEARKARPETRSYTATLFAGGTSKIGEKVIEEAGELVEAALDDQHSDREQRVSAEAADLLYHVFVLLAHCDLTLNDVERVLAGRFGTSGLDEKAARGKNERES